MRSKKEFTNHIKEVLNDPPQQAYEPADWDLLRGQLEEDKDNKRPLFWISGFVILLLGIGLTWAFTSVSPIDELEQQAIENIQSVPIEKVESEKKQIPNQSEPRLIKEQSKPIATHNKKEIILENGGKAIKESENKIPFSSETSPSATLVINHTKIDQPLQKTNALKETQMETITSTPSTRPRLNYTLSILPIKSHFIDYQLQNPLDEFMTTSKENELEMTGKKELDYRPPVELENSTSKRGMIGVYASKPFIKSKILHPFLNSLVLGVRGKYFLKPKWSLEMDLFYVGYKFDTTLPGPPTPKYEVVSSSSTSKSVFYQMGVTYWLGHNRTWHPYIGIGGGNQMFVMDITRATLRNIDTNELEDTQFVIRDFGFRWPTFINYRAGLLYRFKNPRFNFQLEVVLNHKPGKIRRPQIPPSLSLGFNYHF